MEGFGSSAADISSLSNLLEESRNANETKSDKSTQPPIKTNPSNIVLPKDKVSKTLIGKSIWKAEEILSEDSFVDLNDKRPSPRYEFSYMQAIGTEDTFLGLGDKTPLTSDCTHLIIKVHFPNCTMRDLDLDVKNNRIKVSSKNLKLFTYLPVTVDEANGKAKYDSKKEVLTVTLPIINS